MLNKIKQLFCKHDYKRHYTYVTINIFYGWKSAYFCRECSKCKYIEEKELNGAMRQAVLRIDNEKNVKRNEEYEKEIDKIYNDLTSPNADSGKFKGKLCDDCLEEKELNKNGYCEECSKEEGILK